MKCLESVLQWKLNKQDINLQITVCQFGFHKESYEVDLVLEVGLGKECPRDRGNKLFNWVVMECMEECPSHIVHECALDVRIFIVHWMNEIISYQKKIF